jgi:hypothetical protein
MWCSFQAPTRNSLNLSNLKLRLSTINRVNRLAPVLH